ncbi:TIGR03915 family putative DNA repair protein [Pseudopedobacter beijingensis]|uniref:TIGR03915 family putative DNA repair protein n=1 Tax=Pseudopedobacter beijingensis TaxID=1207056 RepID=A0ABW4IDZ2_9SPHI
MVVLKYDGSVEGFYTLVFEVYEYAYQHVKIVKEDNTASFLFFESHTVQASAEKANRVYKKLVEVLGKSGMKLINYTLLSEQEGIENYILDVIRQCLAQKSAAFLKNYADPSVIRLSKMQKMVSREKHRMEAFVRFRLTHDDIYFAEIEPDFNVLPLIARHFKSRYQDQKWIIYDNRRKTGLFYDLDQLSMVEFSSQGNPKDAFTESENAYKVLWKSYFQSTNIKERKNTRLHIQYVPKRYWKYLIEKL